MNAAPPRIGMYGGAFDPPHTAHVLLARTAVQALALDCLHVVPTGGAYHKARALTPAADRLAMAEAAFGALPHVAVDDRELRREGPSYTIDTLRELADEHPGCELHLVLGEDQACTLHTWHDARALLQLAIVSVASRPARTRACDRFVIEDWPDVRVRTLPMPLTDASSTEIRRRAAAGEPLGATVPPAVARYIDLHHLYRTCR